MNAEHSLWVAGKHSVLEALRAGTADILHVSRDRSNDPDIVLARTLAREAGIPVREVTNAELQQQVGDSRVQGMAARIRLHSCRDVDSMMEDISMDGYAPFLLVLDQVQDPHNLGALLRTADAVGVDGVIIPGRRSAPFTGVVARASAGAVSHLRFAQVVNLARALDDIRQHGIWTVGLAAESRVSIFEADLTGPIALVLGGEGEGLRRLTREHCDLLLHIPMSGHVESLNVSVAGGVAMYEVARARLAAGRVP